MRHHLPGGLLALVALAAPLSPVCGDEVRLVAVADNSIAAHQGEETVNAGARPVLRVKGIQHLLVLKFDLAPVRGWRVRAASLRLHAAGEHRLRTVGLSTIAADWGEQVSCFTHAFYPRQRWAGPESDLTDVTFGAGESLYAFQDLSSLLGGWLEVPVPPRIVAAMLCGASFGLVASDEKGQTGWNNDVHSREESQYAPDLLVVGEPAPSTRPPAVAGLRAEPDPAGATLRSVAIRLRFRVPVPVRGQSTPFAYRLEASYGPAGPWHPVPRWLIPFASAPGSAQVVRVPDLAPRTRCRFRLTVLDWAGHASAPAVATVVTGARRPAPAPLRSTPALPARAMAPVAEPPIYGLPDTASLDPVSGEATDAGASGPAFVRNPVWDGRVVHLAAARNEVVSFQLAVRAAEVRAVHASALSGVAGRMAASCIRVWRLWFVRARGGWRGEVALPIGVRVDNRVPGQRYQLLGVDVHVPREAQPGEYRGALTLNAEATHIVPVRLRVWRLSLPDRPRFFVELNGYGSVASLFGVRHNSSEGIAVERAYHIVAREHRSVLNLLPYGQTGRVQEGWAPPIERAGDGAHVVRWHDYDAHYGRLLDGRAFLAAGLPGLPLECQYLPFHESYPLPIADHYGFDTAGHGYPEVIVRHALQAPPIERALPQAYQAAFRAVVSQFVRHFIARGWTRTEMQCYLNNKYYYKDPRQGGAGSSWWLLDEPAHRDDWRALIFYGRLFREGVRQADPQGLARFVYRCDVSRPQWIRHPEEFLPLVDVMYVSGELFRKNRRCMEYRRRYGVRFIHYGTAHPVGEGSAQAEAWALKAYLAGADGILPWNSIGSDRNFEEPEATALLYPGRRFGLSGPLPSVRLKALRRGQQDVEYLIALARARGYTREQLAAAVRPVLDLGARTAAASAEDAGFTLFDGVRPSDLFALRHCIAQALEE